MCVCVKRITSRKLVYRAFVCRALLVVYLTLFICNIKINMQMGLFAMEMSLLVKGESWYA